jgi:hypothetical protein
VVAVQALQQPHLQQPLTMDQLMSSLSEGTASLTSTQDRIKEVESSLQRAYHTLNGSQQAEQTERQAVRAREGAREAGHLLHARSGEAAVAAEAAVNSEIASIQDAVAAGDFSRASDLPQLQARLDVTKAKVAAAQANMEAIAEAEEAAAEEAAAEEEDAETKRLAMALAMAAIAPLEKELSIQKGLQAVVEAEVLEVSRLCADRKETLMLL